MRVLLLLKWKKWCNPEIIIHDLGLRLEYLRQAFFISGTPLEQEPWEFIFFSYYLVLNIFIIRSQMTIGLAFIGAEPNIIDLGPDAGTELCTKEAALGLHLMQSLGAELQRKAQIYCEMHDLGMPPSRWNFADQDNRIIPYEGVIATFITDQQQSALLSIAAAFLELLPKQPLKHRLRQIHEHLSETYFS
ncbi:hypothetical protein B0J13DRAFT_526814 [Dactylonectria estremocensis]|uniref:Uncharacterized protein n=1 Tax=Dactylonectria estremocensis TaxID=1079267 RepID=A0A9P9J563_9HYPO|nr:hypothetical protein B0J13DRAFT_526814 [Dactylonectria estremocensis]